MKHQNLILVVSILLFTSCKNITKDDIKGNWIVVPSGFDKTIFSEINFKDGRVELIDDNLFKELGKYQVENGIIKIQLDRDDLVIETVIKNLEVDTLLIFDSLVYHRNRGIAKSNYDVYELIGMPTNKFLSKEKILLHLIHYYKSGEEIIVRYEDKKVTFDNLSLYLDGGHSKSKVLIFLGKGINLKDLQKIYYRLASIDQSSVWLGTKKEGFLDTHIFKDNIEIWWEDLKNYSSINKIPPQQLSPFEYISKDHYLKNSGKEVKINDKNDLQKIIELEDNERYVISIDANLPIEDYFELKKLIIEKRKLDFQIIAEIK